MSNNRYIAVTYRHMAMNIKRFSKYDEAVNFCVRGSDYGLHAAIMVYDSQEDKVVWNSSFYEDVLEKKVQRMKEKFNIYMQNE